MGCDKGVLRATADRSALPRLRSPGDRRCRCRALHDAPQERALRRQEPDPVNESEVRVPDLPVADIRAEVLVLGAGPGGYTAAFRAADLGKQVVLVERYPTLGGVCLNVGCIPSKALLHVADGITGAAELAAQGVSFGAPQIDLDALRSFKDGVVKKLTGGLAGLAKRREVQVLEGVGSFEGPHLLCVEGVNGATRVAFEHAIVAAGSRAVELPGFPHDDPRLMDSSDALLLEEVPARLLVVGGGIIGLEMASLFHALGSRVSVVELLDQLMFGADPDVVKPLRKLVESRYENVWLGTRVAGVSAEADGLHIGFAGEGAPESDVFDRVLVAVGRRPNGDRVGAEAAGLYVDEGGFIPVDEQLRTNLAHVFAIGDVNGPPMLAHKATHEGRAAAEVIAGHKVKFDPRAIPSVAYTDPEVAWVGLTESQAKAEEIPYERAVFPWQASGRALAIGRAEGMTKLLLDPESRRILGAGLCGPGAGELIAELVLAIELGANVEDLALTIHPHPTLSETVGLAAELAEGTITDLLRPRRR
ncbi:MAG: dihydrolipoyl dehydrogenase [Deltaproteobacteria bacterium]|nr:dihydrolipoyl dehydrogenase [Deltaproteobacteria bacterium]